MYAYTHTHTHTLFLYMHVHTYRHTHTYTQGCHKAAMAPGQRTGPGPPGYILFRWEMPFKIGSAHFIPKFVSVNSSNVVLV